MQKSRLYIDEIVNGEKRFTYKITKLFVCVVSIHNLFREMIF